MTNQLRRLVFIDTETTGLDPNFHEIIEIGMIQVDPESMEEIGEALEIRIRPEHIERASPEALVVNGYNEEDWKDAVSSRTAVEIIDKALDWVMIGGHNVHFDRAFLAALFARHNRKLRIFSHIVDTATLAYPLYIAGILPSLNLDAIGAHFGIERTPVHNALDDAFMSLDAAQRLTSMFSMIEIGRALGYD